MRNFSLLLITLLVISCSNKKSPDEEILDPPPADPIAFIYLQPYDDFTQEEALELAPKITKGLDKVFPGDWTHVKVLPNKALPTNAYYKPRNRYLANELLKDLKWEGDFSYTIGLTHKDISYKIHNQDNYGIQGLTPIRGSKSIVSDFRTKDLVSVIVHEFGHGFWGLQHCSDPKCIMCDFQKLKKKKYNYDLCDEHNKL